MKVRTRASQPQGALRVTFERENRRHDAEIVPTPERALKVAILMLARLDNLIDGDRLTVTEVR